MESKRFDLSNTWTYDCLDESCTKCMEGQLTYMTTFSNTIGCNYGECVILQASLILECLLTK